MVKLKIGVKSVMGPRKTMEDQYVFSEDFLGKGSFFAAVFDGHGGSLASEIAKRELPKEVKKRLKIKLPQELIEEALSASFRSISSGIREKTDVGTTATILLVLEDDVYLAHVGDSSALILAKNGEWAFLTRNHNLTELSEVKNLVEKGALVKSGYLWGRSGSGVNLSRALGDRDFAEWLLDEPDVSHFKLKDEFSHIVLATDGLWNSLDGQKVAAVLKKNRIAQKSAGLLSEMALSEMKKQGWGDNVTVLVITF